MEKTLFKNRTFQVLLIVILGILICWNFYTFLLSANLIALVPTIVQIVVLTLVLTKHKYAKTGINVWAALLMIGGGLVILGKLLKLSVGDNISDGLGKLIMSIILFSMGLVIYNYNQKTVEIRSINEIENQ